MKVIIKRCLVFKFWKNNFPFGSGLSKNQAKKNVLSPKLNQIIYFNNLRVIFLVGLFLQWLLYDLCTFSPVHDATNVGKVYGTESQAENLLLAIH